MCKFAVNSHRKHKAHIAITDIKMRSDWQVSGASFLRQKTCRCERGFWRHFSGARNWRQKLAGIEHVLFQASFCRETQPLIGRLTGDRIFAKRITTFSNKKLA